VVLALQEEPFF